MSLNTITVELPRMLADLIGGPRRIDVVASSIGEAIEAVARDLPALRVHLFEESDALRRHVNVFRNDLIIIGAERHLEPVDPGDTVTIAQAASGG